MARTRRNLDPHGQAAQVLQQLKREPAGWRRERLLAVKLGLEDQLDLEEIAAYLGRARSCIQGWLDRFRRGGLDALLAPPRRGQGPASPLSAELAQTLGRKLAAGAFRRAADAQRWLLEEGGLSVKLTTVYKYLKKAGARLKVPRPCHEKKDRWAAEAFREALAVHLVALDLPADRPVRLWVADEMRYGLLPITRRVWSLRGVRPVCPVHPRYEWAYVYGAAEVGGQARVEFLYGSTVDLQHSALFLEQVGAREPGATHVVIWDGAGFHPQDGAAGLPDNVRLLPLPSYSPELNPIEGLWDQLKDHLCNKVFASLRAMQKAITDFLRPLWENPERVRDLIGYGWLLAQAKAFFRQLSTSIAV
jgi:transposase